MSNKVETLFREILSATTFLTPVSSQSRGGKASVLCRLAPGKDNDLNAFIKKIMHQSTIHNVSTHCCRQYVMKEDKLVLGTHFSVEGPSAASVVSFLKVIGHEVTKTISATEALTTARVRPAAPARDNERVSGFKPVMRVLERSVNEKGVMNEVVEINLPIRADLNTPNAKGRGAKTL